MKENLVIGRGTTVGDGTIITDSVIGKNCVIGKTSKKNKYINKKALTKRVWRRLCGGLTSSHKGSPSTLMLCEHLCLL